MTRARRAAAALLALLPAAACANHAEERAAPAWPAGDTARGVVAVVGAEPLTRVVLRLPGGELEVGGEAAGELRAAEGLEVAVSGHWDQGRVHPAAWRVRALGDLPAFDGTLEVAGDSAVLVTPDGIRHAFPAAPAALRALAGRHVWIAAPPGTEPRQWGVLGNGS